MRTRLIAALALLLVVATATGTSAAAGAAAQTAPRSGPYRALARADAMLVRLTDPGAPAIPRGEVLDGGPAVAQAEFDSTGVSQGYAAAPTPGEQVASLPLVANGLLAGHAPPLPAYPFLVASTFPVTPSARQEQASYLISSTSSAEGTVAESRLGGLTGDDVAMLSTTAYAASSRDASGALVAEARSTVQGFSIGPLLTLGDVSGFARVTSLPGEEPVIESNFSVGTITVAGIKFGLTSGGIQPVGGLLPNLQTAVLDQLLAPAGISLEVLPAEEIEGGSDSGGLRISFQQEVPTQGLVQVTLTLGRALALSESAAARPPSTPNAGTPTAPASAPAPRPPTGPIGSSSAPIARPSTGGVPSGTSGTKQPAATFASPSSFVPLITDGGVRFYLSLVAAAAAAAAAGHIFGATIRRPTVTRVPPLALPALTLASATTTRTRGVRP